MLEIERSQGDDEDEYELSRDEYLARWGDSEQWPTTTKELEEWERDIDAYRRGLGSRLSDGN